MMIQSVFGNHSALENRVQDFWILCDFSKRLFNYVLGKAYQFSSQRLPFIFHQQYLYKMLNYATNSVAIYYQILVSSVFLKFSCSYQCLILCSKSYLKEETDPIQIVPHVIVDLRQSYCTIQFNSYFQKFVKQFLSPCPCCLNLVSPILLIF